MKELNDLVELAQMATAGDWTIDIRGSVVAVDDQANSGFVICAASGCDKASNAAFIAAANPETILVIAEAYLALEQQRDALAVLAEERRQFIVNGVEIGDILLPVIEGDPAVGIYERCLLETNFAADAYLNSVRSNAVQELADAWYAIANETSDGVSISDSTRLKYRQRADDAADFAAKLRAGKDGK